MAMKPRHSLRTKVDAGQKLSVPCDWHKMTRKKAGQWDPRAVIVVVGRPCEEIAGPSTAAVNKCCVIAEMGVWIAWITKARNSGDVDARTTTHLNSRGRNGGRRRRGRHNQQRALQAIHLWYIGATWLSGPKIKERKNKTILTRGNRNTRRMNGANSR